MIFIDRYKHMKCDFSDIHEAIEFWHTDYKGDLELYQMLGLTLAEYKHFVENEEGFKGYLYNKYARNNFDFSLDWDDDGVCILDKLNWHIQNGDCDYIDGNITIELRKFEEDDE